MPKPDEKQNFWTTMPGLLTGIAALLTSATGLLVVMHPRDGGGLKEGSPAVAVSPKDPAGVAPNAAGGGSAGGSVMPKQQKPTVLVVGKDGTTTTVLLDGFKHWFTNDAVELKSGQSIPFDKIKSIDFLTVHEFQRDIRVILTNGQVVDGSTECGLSEDGFKGETDIGPFSISIVNLKQIVFQR